MPRIEKNGRQAENHPDLLEDGRGAKEEDEVNCPTFYAVMTGDDPDGVHECDCQPDDTMFHGLLLKVEKPSKMAILECITPELFSKGRLLACSALVTLCSKNKSMKTYMALELFSLATNGTQELHNNPPFSAWRSTLVACSVGLKKDRLDEVWN